MMKTVEEWARHLDDLTVDGVATVIATNLQRWFQAGNATNKINIETFLTNALYGWYKVLAQDPIPEAPPKSPAVPPSKPDPLFFVRSDRNQIFLCRGDDVVEGCVAALGLLGRKVEVQQLDAMQIEICAEYRSFATDVEAALLEGVDAECEAERQEELRRQQRI